MSVKKESLFKQKLKQARISQQHRDMTSQKDTYKNQAFPKVFKIDNFDTKNQTSQKSAQQHPYQAGNESVIEEKNSQQEVFEELTYLKRNKQSLDQVLSENDLNQINNQNWNTVNSMNEQERLNYLNLIQNTLPANFIEKLRKKQTNPNHRKLPNPKSVSELINQNSKFNRFKSQKFAQIIKNEKQMNETQQGDAQKLQTEDETQNHKTIIDNIYVNIKTQKLAYIDQNMFMNLTQDDKTSFVNFIKIHQMITSDNNQSQIIGAQLTLYWVKNIFPTQNCVFFVAKIPFHVRIMLTKIYSLLNTIEANLKSTKFYSCYLQLLLKSVQILTCCYKNLSDRQLDQQITFYQLQFQKSQKSLKEFIQQKTNPIHQSQYPSQKQSQQILFESLAILYQSLKQQKTLRAENLKLSREVIQIQEKFQKLKSSTKIQDFIEALLIEQTLTKQQFQEYELYPKINQFLQNITDFWCCKISTNLQNLSQKLSQVHQFYDVLFKLVTSLNKKRKGFPFYASLIQKLFEGLLDVVQKPFLRSPLEEIVSKEFPQKLNSKKNKVNKSIKSPVILKILYIYRQMSGKSNKLAQFLQSSKSNWVLTEQQTNMIVYINFSHYLDAHDLKAEQIEMLQKMFQWIKNQLRKTLKKQNSINLISFDPDQLLSTLLGLFLSSQQEIYSLMDQCLLDEVFRLAINFYEVDINQQTSVQQILTEQSIKQMIQNYNYNSFGNDIFTKVIFWVAVSINPQIESLIGEEIMMRYPMLFYYASEPNFAQNQTENQNNSHQLLGDVSHYIKSSSNPKSLYFTYGSNQQIKANLLKLLFLNLDFSQIKSIDHKKLQKLIGQKIADETRGFRLSKAKLNEKNYFYQYLTRPFLKAEKYQQLF